MAARIRKIRHDENTRLKIQTGKILYHLQRHIFGEEEMSRTQVTAALGLLKKTLPDLQATQISADSDNPPKLVIEWAKPSES